MKKSILIAAAMVILFSIGAQAQTTESPVVHGPGFIDLDGDGFRDGAPDADGDGIPNGLDEDYVRAGSGTQNAWAMRKMYHYRRAMERGTTLRTGDAVCTMRETRWERRSEFAPYGRNSRMNNRINRTDVVRRGRPM